MKLSIFGHISAMMNCVIFSLKNKFRFKRAIKSLRDKPIFTNIWFSLSQIKSFQLLFCWFGIIMIINYFAIVNLSAQIENFTTQNTKCLAKILFQINYVSTMCLTDNTLIVYLDQKYIYLLFLFYVLCQLIKSTLGW